MNLSESFEDYLEAIYVSEVEGRECKSVHLARTMGVSKAAVSIAMKELLDKGFIDKTPYSSLKLTDSGREIAKRVYHRHTTIKSYLLKIGISQENAEKDCCKIEHIISEETIKAIEKELKKMK